MLTTCRTTGSTLSDTVLAAVTLADGVLPVTIDRPESLNFADRRCWQGWPTRSRRATDPRVKVVRPWAPVAAFSSEGHR